MGAQIETKGLENKMSSSTFQLGMCSISVATLRMQYRGVAVTDRWQGLTAKKTPQIKLSNRLLIGSRCWKLSWLELDTQRISIG